MLRSQDLVGVEEVSSEPRAETTKQQSRNAILLVLAVHAGMGRVVFLTLCSSCDAAGAPIETSASEQSCRDP